MKEKIKHYQSKVERKIIMRQRIFFFITILLLIISITNIFQGKLAWYLALEGIVLSTLIGIGLSRMFRIFWSTEKGKVVSQLDTLGIILLVAYIAIEVRRKWIFAHWFAGEELNAFGLTVLTGLLLGRFLGTIFFVKKVLDENATQKSKELPVR